MLVLTRKLQQQINIGDNITVTVLRVKGNTVRLGIDAPREIRVRRNELLPKDSESPSVAAPDRSVAGEDAQKTGRQQNTAKNQNSATGKLASQVESNVTEPFRDTQRLPATGSEAFASSPLAAHIAALCH